MKKQKQSWETIKDKADLPAFDVWKEFISLAEKEKCFFCSKKIKILIPHPNQVVHFLGFIEPEYLVHIQTTHGYDPETFQYFFKELLKNGQDNKKTG